MLNRLCARIRAQDNDVWRTATRSAPIVVQLVFAAAFGVGWLLGHFPIDSHAGYRIMLAATFIITAFASLLVGARILGSRSPRRRGLGLAVGGSGLALLAGGLPWALIFLSLVDTI
ncbi:MULTISPECIES: hypothetical protein [Mycolicibacter]|uniref:Uncharacterized protein n=1 Tax=Mycolicibacter virginiensis TaxID=1795032 RepID=A0A9X7NZP5_9MYCO|nr:MULTISPECIES: hypothetical protein [Mycobacteriaceae]PQM53275.1 hypothetical protein C5U48_05195 [Mycolicibacter virginiensis]ULP48211.1 hypothetical protein MJO54_03360 [Mycolicibacter virginiensis]